MTALDHVARPSPMPWYRVGEIWLVLALLAFSIAISFVLLGAAIEHPDVHLVVPNAVKQPASMPPMGNAPHDASDEPPSD